MYKIEPLQGFWTITHLICGATFQITGQKILESKQHIACSNCGIPINTDIFKNSVNKFAIAIRELNIVTQMPGDKNRFAWKINPPINIIAEEYGEEKEGN